MNREKRKVEDGCLGGGDIVTRYMLIVKGGRVKELLKGVITGVAGVLLLVILVLVFRFFGERDRKIYEYMEAQRELQVLQEDITHHPLDEFLEEPGIRGATDSAVDEFQRKRDEALQRFRNRRAD